MNRDSIGGRGMFAPMGSGVYSIDMPMDVVPPPPSRDSWADMHPPPPDVAVDTPPPPPDVPVAAGGGMLPPQGDRPARISRCKSICNSLGVAAINGFVKVPLSHGMGVAVALAGRAGTTALTGIGDAAAAGVGSVTAVAGLAIGSAAGYRAGDLVAHRLGLGEYREAFKFGGAAFGVMPSIGAVMYSMRAANPYQQVVLLSLQVLFREVTQIVRDSVGNGVLMDVLPALEVLGHDGIAPLAGRELELFNVARTCIATGVYTGSSMAHQVLLQDTLTSVFGFPPGYDFSEVLTSGLGTANSSLSNEVFDDLQGPLMLCALALARGYSVRWKSGGGFSQLIENLAMGPRVRENIADHAAMRVAGWAPTDLAAMVSNQYAPGSAEFVKLRLLTGAVQGMTEFRHHFATYGREGIRRRRAAAAQPV
ncbi:MAG: hypothetical protein H7255_21515 [Ramlibacter sp.]|nr:hypothetical protein [Ramlibacter sp.]